MKLLLENWRKYIKEVEAFDDIATTPEQIQQSIDWFYSSPKFDRGKKKGEESWNGHVIITYGLPKGDEFHFVVNKDGKPVAYVASAPFRDGHAVGNIRKNTKDFYATDLYNWMTNKYGVLYSDKAQTKDGAGIWERFPNKEKVETEKEDGKGRWRYRIGKEVNEIFGFGKKKNTDMSPEEREFHKQQFAFDAEDFQEMYDALKLYKVLMYGGRYRGTDQHKMRKSRKAWTQMGKAGRKRRLKEIAAFHDNVLRPMADKAAGYASEIESGTFVDATPRNDYWLSGINPKRIRKMLPKWAKAFESALRVSANFYKNEAPKYGLEEWEPQPGLEDIKDFMDLASIQEE